MVAQEQYSRQILNSNFFKFERSKKCVDFKMIFFLSTLFRVVQMIQFSPKNISKDSFLALDGFSVSIFFKRLVIF